MKALVVLVCLLSLALLADILTGFYATVESMSYSHATIFGHSTGEMIALTYIGFLVLLVLTCCTVDALENN